MTKRTKLLFFLFAGAFTVFISAVPSEGKSTFTSGARRNTLIELYTSQGCSSCPPAEKWLNGLERSPKLWKEIIPVAFHVAYWDYLGWKDPYSSPLFSERQRRINRTGAIRSVYTPCFVVNGKEWRGWFSGFGLPEPGDGAGVLEAVLRKGEMEVSYPSSGKELVLNVAILGSGIETYVKKGENRGRKLKEDFVVLSYGTYLSEEGKWSFRMPEVKGVKALKYAVALWVSGKNTPYIPIQATGGWLK